MGYSEETPNYHLPQYIGGDRPSYLGDWNQAMGIVDGAMHDNALDIADNKTAVSNMKTYVDNSVSDLTESVDNKLTVVDTKLEDVYTKSEVVSAFVSKSLGGICVVAGDSISLGTGTTNPATDSWCAQLAAMRNFTLYNYAQNNAGFVAAGTGTPSRTFIQQLQAAAADNSFINAAVRIVIVAGGINDNSYVSQLEGATKSTLQYAKTTFPNARIVCVPVLAGSEILPNVSGGNRALHIPPIIKGSLATGVEVIEGAWTWLIGMNNLSSDGVHPNTAGALEVAQNMNGCLESGSYFVSRTGVVTGNENFNTAQLTATLINGVVTIEGLAIAQRATSPNSKICDLPGWCKNSQTVTALAFFSESAKQAFIFKGNTSLSLIQAANTSDPYVYINSISFPVGVS